jgi:hypothetical protein
LQAKNSRKIQKKPMKLLKSTFFVEGVGAEIVFVEKISNYSI